MTACPLVSVVIATFNTGRFLPRAVRSALCQTYPNIEVCVIDDGSTDDTAELLQSLARKDSRLTWHSQTNAGQARAKNEGVRRTRGALVAFLDADDFWAPDKVQKQVPLFGRPIVGVVYSDLAYVDERDEVFSLPRSRYHRGRVTRELFLENFIPFGSAVVRRSCLERLGAFDESLSMGIDWDLWLRLSADWEFDFHPEPLLFYRLWSGQMSKNFAGRYEGTAKIMQRFLTANPGRIEPSTRRAAWVSTYVGHARLLAEHSQKRRALGFLARAVLASPLCGRPWLELARLPFIR